MFPYGAFGVCLRDGRSKLRRPDPSGAEQWPPSRHRSLTALIRSSGVALLHLLTRLIFLRLPRLLLFGWDSHTGLRHLGAHTIFRCRAQDDHCPVLGGGACGETLLVDRVAALLTCAGA